jgi:1,2-diacylglycerol 3-beta-galactosyltransferase
MMDLVSVALRVPISRAFETYAPDLVVSVHPLMQDVPLSILRGMGRATPFVTVVTDYVSIHATWFDPGVDLCFVASEEAWDLALRAGLTERTLRLCGLPIRPSFSRERRSKPELRRVLGMEPHLPVVLLVGGGEGMGPVEQIARAVAGVLVSSRGTPSAQLAVVCGWNERLYDDLRRSDWGIPVSVNRYVENMAEWMHASDLIITKAGPGTIAEALIVGLPIVLSGHLPGQEEGNVPWVLKHRIGAYSEDPDDIAALVARWLGPERQRLNDMSARARELGKPDAATEIVREIVTLLD